MPFGFKDRKVAERLAQMAKEGRNMNSGDGTLRYTSARQPVNRQWVGYVESAEAATEVFVLDENGADTAVVTIQVVEVEVQLWHRERDDSNNNHQRLVPFVDADGNTVTITAYYRGLKALTEEFVDLEQDLINGDVWIESHTGGGHVVIQFSILYLAPYTDEISSPCEAVVAEVTSVSCNSSGVAVGDEVTVYDPSACWFNVPIEVLEGATGQAVLMQADEYGSVPDCVEQETAACWWLVQHLCCTEELYAE